MGKLHDVEQAIVTYLDTGIGGTGLGGTGYAGEFPRAAVATTVREWMFALDGGAPPVEIPSDDNNFHASMGGMFRGIYTSRQQALDDAWTIITDLPWDANNVTGIERVNYDSPPTILREVINLEKDQIGRAHV